jgi:hypothetical protein
MKSFATGPRQGRSGEQPAAPSQSGNPGPTVVGTQRRLRALAARSWSPQAIEQETGIPAQLIRRELDGRGDLAPNLAGAVAAAYDRLWDRQPPAVTRADRDAAAEITARAVRGGWAPPMAWDDDLIDLPAARPEPGWRRRGTYRRSADLVEDAEFIREHGGYRDANLSQVAMRMGVRRDRLDQAYRRARRYAAGASAGRDAGRSEPEAEAG